jgi:hypothetical protein
MTIRILHFALLGAVMMPLVYGQSDSGRMTGTITDPSTAVVPNASVTVKNEKTGQTRKALTNDQGVYLPL